MEAVAALVLPHIEEDFSWVCIVVGVNKQMSILLDMDHHWEEHFELKCEDLQSPFARFAMYRYVNCKYILPTVYDTSVALKYAVNITVQPSKGSFARQAFRQFMTARLQLDEYFPEDDTPCAQFQHLAPSENTPGCRNIHCIADIPVLVVFCADNDVILPLIQGNLEGLLQVMEEDIEPESDDSFDCSECGHEHHDWDSWM